MATLTLTVAASTDDAYIHAGVGYDDGFAAMTAGGVGVGPPANYGQGWRFTNVTLTAADTINSAYLSMMKNGTEWKLVTHRWTCVNEDNTPTFSSGNPPGSRSISATIVAESNDVNTTDGTVYEFPDSSGDKVTFGAAVASVIARGGWASGNALAVVNNSDQDASANENNSNKSYHTWDSSVSASEPQLVIDYTAPPSPAGVAADYDFFPKTKMRPVK
jgi:hypothetical protein